MNDNITLVLHHGGRFTPRASDGKVEYIGGEFDVWEDISADCLNAFILYDLEVEDVPCVGRKFTWYRPNGTTKSRLDKFLVSVEWTVKWQGSTQFILDRNFSDHCPILLTSTRNKNKKALAGGTVGSSTLK